MTVQSARAAYRRALAAHRRAIAVHEAAAALHERCGKLESSARETMAADLERQRLASAQRLHPERRSSRTPKVSRDA